MSVLLTEPEDYLNAMLFYLRWRNNPKMRAPKIKTNADALSELDTLL